MMNDLAPKLDRRKRAAWGANKSIEDAVKKTKNNTLRTHLFNTTVLPALTYALATWALRKQDENARYKGWRGYRQNWSSTASVTIDSSSEGWYICVVKSDGNDMEPIEYRLRRYCKIPGESFMSLTVIAIETRPRFIRASWNVSADEGIKLR
ncbi:hypothetical protein Y032_0002g766 [Ancylostoma ceylanicum]|nr:hypothetical protein Y032_0002g766 [Ancylostoma ceylanicum]